MALSKEDYTVWPHTRPPNPVEPIFWFRWVLWNRDAIKSHSPKSHCSEEGLESLLNYRFIDAEEYINPLNCLQEERVNPGLERPEGNGQWPKKNQPASQGNPFHPGCPGSIFCHSRCDLGRRIGLPPYLFPGDRQ